jgi:hypothetical protein
MGRKRTKAVCTTSPPKKMNWWYGAIINWMIANPQKRLYDCARELNVTQAWLSVIINTDMFKAELARRQEALGEHVTLSLSDKIAGVAHMALDAQLAELEEGMLSGKDLRETSTMALKALGFIGDKPAQAVQVNNNFGPVVTREEIRNAQREFYATHGGLPAASLDLAGTKAEEL